MSSTLSTDTVRQMEEIYQCPISMELMNQPLMMRCGHTFERQGIHLHLVQNRRDFCPLCRKRIRFAQGIPNVLVKQAIDNLKKKLLVNEMKNKMGVFVRHDGLRIRYVDKKATLKDLMQELIVMTGASKMEILLKHYMITCNGKTLNFLYSKEPTLMLNLFLMNNSTVNVEKRELRTVSKVGVSA